jgi:hypothetical protein
MVIYAPGDPESEDGAREHASAGVGLFLTGSAIEGALIWKSRKPLKWIRS